MIKFNNKDVIPRFNGQNVSRVMYNGKQVWPKLNNVVEIQLADTVAGDVCVWDGSKKRFFRFSDSGATDDIRNYTPIGVVVVPASHTDDGTARVTSLAVMDYNNPDEGNTSGNVDMYWGGGGYDVPNLDNKEMYPAIAEDFRSISGEQQITSWYDLGSIEENSPSDYFNTYPNPYDEGTYYLVGTTTSAYRAIPSPYLTGGGKNEIYHSTDNTGNIFADMDGKSNTEKILAVDNGGSTDWQTAETIIDRYNVKTNHPAAQCCWRFHTTGTTQGDWYLPAVGELGYLVARGKAIDASISKVASFGFSALSSSLMHYWSSTESSSGNVVNLVFGGNFAYWNSVNKGYLNCVRAFLAVSPLGE